MKQFCVASLLLLSAASAETTPSISEAALRKHVVELASDAYEGRDAGYPGERKAAQYIADQFKRIGLLPPADSKPSYFQEFAFNPQRPPVPWAVLTARNVVAS